MADVHTPEIRSKNMRAIKAKNTKPELIVRKHLHSLGYRYKIGAKKFGFKPDIVLPKYRTVVFVHGCFWHRHEGCSLASIPKSNMEKWKAKFEANVLRDRRNIQIVLREKWTPVVIWECSVRNGSFRSTNFKECIGAGKRYDIPGKPS